MRQQTGTRGFTIPEMFVASAIVGILTVMVFAAYLAGLKAFFKSQAQNEMLAQLQLAARRISLPMEQTAAASITLAGNGKALSFLTSYDEDGVPQFIGPAAPRWEAYLVFYYDAPNKQLLKSRYNLPATAPQVWTPTPIERYNPGTGPKNLNWYLRDGERQARLVENFQVELEPSLPNGYRFHMDALRPREGNRPESRSSMDWTVVIRN